MELSGHGSNLIAHEDLGHFWKPIIGVHKFYNKKFPLVYESDKSGDSLYEEHGATLKHKCGKRIVTLPFSLFLSFCSFFFSFFVGFFGLSLSLLGASLATFILITSHGTMF